MPGASLSTRMVPMPPLKFEEPYSTSMNDDEITWLLMMPLLTMLLIPTLIFMVASEKVQCPLTSAFVCPKRSSALCSDQERGVCCTVVSEQEQGLLEMIRIAGGRLDSYLLGNWLFCFVYSAMFCGFFVLTMKASGATAAHQLSSGPVLYMVISWAGAQTGFVLFFGLCVFSKARYAAIFGIISVLVATVCGLVLALLLPSRPMPLLAFLFPPLAYSRTVGALLR